jgi:Zn-dependent protease with chaperone function
MAVAVLGFGWVDLVRSATGDILILDEILASLPAFVAFIAAWWIFYPFDRKIREARLIRDLDEGRPLAAPSTRGSWILQQVRTNLLLLLIPILLVATAADVGRRLAALAQADVEWVGTVAGIAAAIPMILIAPWVVVRLLDAVPLPEGEVRTELEASCQRAGVQVRDLMLWRTGGSMVNGAVTGFFPHARWVLLTDGLLEHLERDQLLAVLGHELAHVRKRHMFWLAASLFALSLALGAFLDPLISVIHERVIAGGGDFESMSRWMEWVNVFAVAVVLLGTLAGFGWVSRRFERQADAFAAVHLSRKSTETTGIWILPAAVNAMRSALGAVAAFNGVDPARRSWRHGSIASRQDQLTSIEGRPADELPVDAVVNWIKLASAVLIIAGVVFLILSVLNEGGGA